LELISAQNSDESPASQCSTQFADQNEKISSYEENPTRARTRIQLISISINPDGKPPCRKVLNNNGDQYEKPKTRKKNLLAAVETTRIPTDWTNPTTMQFISISLST